jgi:hypothetical protein
MDDYPYNQDGQLVSRSNYVRITIRIYETRPSAMMDLTIEEVTIAANQRYDQLQAEQIQRTATAVADFIQPAHATEEQPTLWRNNAGGCLHRSLIYFRLIDFQTPVVMHTQCQQSIIRAIEVSQTGNPDEIATALIAHANARYNT